MYRLCLLIPYFGKKPSDFDVWALSASYNSDIDFYLITDIDFGKLPPNIYVYEISFAELKERINKMYDFEVVLNNPYKLCDFRPAYGEIFADILRGYDYWGYCDVDMVFGNIRKFVTDDILARYDKIYQLGHLTLYHNDSCMNGLYKENVPGTIDFKTVFTTNYSCHFDEAGLVEKQKKLNVKAYTKYDFWDINSGIFPFKSYWKGEQVLHVFKWEKGTLWNYLFREKSVPEIEIREICYVHMQKRRLLNDITQSGNDFIIVPNKFIDAYDIVIDGEFIKNANPDKLYFEAYKKRIKMIVQNLRNGALKYRFYRLIGK